ncbi:MAG: ABC transporter permease subunit, partial [Thiobacillus sp.]|nr:ABC transporter permease subunit [Thiobacillus sp.]
LPMYRRIVDAGAERIVAVPAGDALTVALRHEDASWSEFLADRDDFEGDVVCRLLASVDEAAQSLGVTGGRRLWRVHLPMLRVPLLTALALAFVDIMKELPITLMTRPFGWDTLAVRVFEMTSEGEWERAALPAAAIALVGLLPVIFLIRKSDHALAC